MYHFRLLPKGYFDLDLEASTSAEVRETFLNSKDAMREGQVTDTFAALNTAITGDLAKAAQNAKVLEQPRALPAPAMPKPQGDQEGAAAGAEAQEGAQSEEYSDSEESLPGDPLCSLILGQAKAKGSARERSRTPPTRHSRRVGGGAAASSTSGPPRNNRTTTKKETTPKKETNKEIPQDSPGSAPRGKPGKARGKGARLPTDIDELLNREGFDELHDKFQKVHNQKSKVATEKESF